MALTAHSRSPEAGAGARPAGRRPRDGRRQAKLAFQVISELYEHRRSTLITANRPFKDWTKVFPDALDAQVIAERLTERSERPS